MLVASDRRDLAAGDRHRDRDRGDRVGAIGIAGLAEADLVADVQVADRDRLAALGDDRRAGDRDRPGPAILGGERDLRTADRPDRDRPARLPLPLSPPLPLPLPQPWPSPRPMPLRTLVLLRTPVVIVRGLGRGGSPRRRAFATSVLGAAVIAIKGTASAMPATIKTAMRNPPRRRGDGGPAGRGDGRLDWFLDHDDPPRCGAIAEGETALAEP